MAKVGYIMAISQYDKLEEDRKWTNETDRCGNN